MFGAGSGWVAHTLVAATVTHTASQAKSEVARSAGRSSMLAADPRRSGIRLAAQPVRAVRTASGLVLPASCITSLKADLGSTLVTVGESFSDASSVRATFTYGQGQSSSLGAAISYGGAFTASGSTSVSKGAGSGFGPVTGAVNRAYRTNFDYRRYYTLCNTSPSYSTVKATAWYGGATAVSISDVAMGKCVGYGVNGHYWISSSSATRLSGAASLAGAIGINLSAQTGWSSSARLDYYMNATGHPVCGKDGYPGSSPGLVQVHSSVYNG